jgi:hypothetical protein
MRMLTLSGSPLRRAAVGAALALAVVSIATRGNSAQSLSYASGQNVSPAFEGWETDANGTSYFVFGYMNNNWEEEIDVPVGADNSFNLLGADLGQPTHFLPRRNRFVFKVPVPKDFGNKELIWTLKTNGVTEKAYATLRQDYFIDNVVIASETGALGPGSSNPTIRANKAPIVQLPGGKTVSARVGQPVQLVATVADDGVPKAPGQGAPMPPQAQITRRAMMPPQRITVGKFVGLHLSWFVYRGGGKVTFDPPQTKVWEDTRAGANSPWAPVWVAPPLPADNTWTVSATFTEPGTYVLRARADDGALLGDQELTVTVGK